MPKKKRKSSECNQAVNVEASSASDKLRKAALKGNVATIMDLLTEPPHSESDAAECLEEAAGDALCLAAGYGRIDVIRVLLQHKVDVNHRSEKTQGRSALHEACMWKEGRPVVSMLLEARADVELKSRNNRRVTARQIASKAGMEDVAALLPPPPPIASLPSLAARSGSKEAASKADVAATSAGHKREKRVAVPFHLMPSVRARLEKLRDALGVTSRVELPPDGSSINLRAKVVSTPEKNKVAVRDKRLPSVCQQCKNSGSAVSGLPEICCEACVNQRGQDCEKQPPAEPLGSSLAPSRSSSPSFASSQSIKAEPANSSDSAAERQFFAWQPPGPRTRFWSSSCTDEGKRTARAYAQVFGRQALPIAGWRDTIIAAIRNNPVVILRGETGCGKSTQVPQFIIEEWSDNAHVVVTQPRRLAAVTLAERVAAERGEVVGGESVGYHIGGEEHLPTQAGGSIVFCTEGSLLRKLRGGAIGVSHFVIDEAHERSVDCDLLLCILREILARHASPSVIPLASDDEDEEGEFLEEAFHGPRLIVMSATVDTARLLHYFGGSRVVEVVDVPGRAFPVEKYYLEDAVKYLGPALEAESCSSACRFPAGVWSKTNGNADWEPAPEAADHYSSMAIAQVRRIDDRSIPLGVIAAILRKRLVDFSSRCALMQTQGIPDEDVVAVNLASSKEVGMAPGAVLVFLPGRAEIAATRSWLECNEDLMRGCFFVELHSTADRLAKHAAFARAPHNRMKVVLSTNVAETSLTIPDVDCVIDSGLVRVSDELRGALRTTWAGKSNTKQRCGRAGRVRPGEYFAMFTAKRYDQLPSEIAPEIMRRNLTRLVLLVHEMVELSMVASAEVSRSLSDQEMDLAGTPASLLTKTLDPPHAKQLSHADEELREIGAISSEGRITDLGHLLGALPTEPRLGLSLAVGMLFGLHAEMARVVAVLSIQPSYRIMLPTGTGITEPRSDILTVAYDLACFEACIGIMEEQQFCEAKNIPVHAMQMMKLTARQLQESMMRSANFPEPQANASPCDAIRANWGILSWLLALGLGQNVAVHSGAGNLWMQRGPGKVSRESSWSDGVCLENMEQSVILFGSLVPVQGRRICQNVSEVDILALLLFSLRLEWRDGHGVAAGWLRITGALEDLSLVGSLGVALFRLLEQEATKLCARRSVGEEHAKLIQEWRTCIYKIIRLQAEAVPDSQCEEVAMGMETDDAESADR